MDSEGGVKASFISFGENSRRENLPSKQWPWERKDGVFKLGTEVRETVRKKKAP